MTERSIAQIVCATCGVSFHPLSGRAATSKYCSNKCFSSRTRFRDYGAEFDKRVRPNANGCLEWAGNLNDKGYGRFSGPAGVVPAHRYAYERGNGPIPDGMFVCHSCDNPKCVNPEHLWIGDAAANNRDRDAKGRRIDVVTSHSEMSPNSKLSNAQARAVKFDPRPAPAVAKELGVSETTIRSIRQGKAWKHV